MSREVAMNDYASVADLYDSYVTDVRDHDFWSYWAALATGPILEVTAGTGRVTGVLRAASGHRLAALDLAPAMLRRLVARFRGMWPPVWAVGGDMTRLPFASRSFHLVAVPFNSLGELVGVEDRAAALAELSRVLVVAGRAIVTLHDPSRRRQTLDGTVSTLGPFVAGNRRLEVLVRGRLIDADVAESDQRYRLLASDGEVVEERSFALRFALPDLSALVGAAAAAGLEPQALFGDYDRSAYVPGTSPFILAVFGRVR